MTVMSAYIALILALIGWVFALNYWLDARMSVRVLVDFGLTNGRLRIAKAQRRQALFRFGYLTLLVGKAGQLVYILNSRPVDATLRPATQVIVSLFMVSVVVVTVDGWLAGRERHAIAARTRVPTESEIDDLLEHDDGGGEVDAVMTRDPQDQDENDH